MMKPETEILDQEMSVGDTTCTICFAEFLDSDDLLIHVKQMHNEVNTKYCQFCRETYKDMLNYAEHVRDEHLLELRCCRFCTKAFLDGSVLNLHEKSHQKADNAYSCSQCPLVYTERVLLESHERRMHDNDKEGCYLRCVSFLSYILNMKAGVLLQTVGKKTFLCATCNFSTTHLQIYIKHLRTKKCKGFVCDQCSGWYKTKKGLLHHVKFGKSCSSVKRDLLVETVACRVCNKQVRPKMMEKHLQNCKAFKCIDCDIICKNIEELSAHQTKEHPADMTVMRCMFCSKEFIGKGPMNKHIERVHQPSFHLYKYKCHDCNFIFKHPQKLFAHFFSKHKDLEPFTCKICNRTFRVRKGFTLHIKVEHNSVGFVEFNDKYHVFFTEKKSEAPFVPQCVVAKEMFQNQNDQEPEALSIPSLDIDTDATEVDTEDDKPTNRKLPMQHKQDKKPRMTRKEPVMIYSSDEEPLLEVKKRVLKKKRQTKRPWILRKGSKPQFTCQVCHKNCYTYQNHQNHMSTHYNDLKIECVKCSKSFNTMEDLNSHITKEHSSSKLTETLKNMLQKKKQDHNNSIDEPETLKKPNMFNITLKKVNFEKSAVSATIKPVESDLSVRNFLENFTPETTEAPDAKIKIDSSISIAPLTSSFRQPTIKLTKFKPEQFNQQVSLRMPERFKRLDNYVKTKVSVKLVNETEKDYIIPDYTDHDYSDTFHDDRIDNIPEVAHEVSLEGTEEPPKPIPTKIIIPKMPKGYSKIHIATLQPEAPYFKIIKVDSENLNEIDIGEANEEVNVPVTRTDVIDLPGGTKLVTANPLAHLLGGTPLDKILEPIKSKYRPTRDFPGMLAQAMLKLDEVPVPKKRKSRAKKAKNPEQNNVIHYTTGEHSE